MITITDYWMDGRDSKYRIECTGQIQAAAIITVDRVNALLELAELDGIKRDKVSSGWRPPSINAATKNAAKSSKHLTGEACDIYDPDRALAQWCLKNTDVLAECGLWMESPAWCAKWNEKTQQWDYWVHLQRIPPKSGKRIYVPSTKPPSAPFLDGEPSAPYRIKL